MYACTMNVPSVDPALLVALPFISLLGNVPLLVGDITLLVGDDPVLVRDVTLLVGDITLLVGDVTLLVGDVTLLVGDITLLGVGVPFPRTQFIIVHTVKCKH